jgi:hypothetical protein
MTFRMMLVQWTCVKPNSDVNDFTDELIFALIPKTTKKVTYFWSLFK